LTDLLCSSFNAPKPLLSIPVHRILRPGGKLIFCEHGRAPDQNINKWQDIINPAWKKINGGCNLNRPISNLIEESGFKIVNLDAKYNSPL
jgi:hypothetical protein